MTPELTNLYRIEGWETTQKDGREIVIVNGQAYPPAHPFQIHCKIYREETNPELKYQSMKRMHDMLWPEYVKTWNAWDERRFRTHCEHWTYITYAGGASTAKSNCAARIGLLYWLADPSHRTVIVASTTLESLNSRIFGYCIRFLSEAKLPIVYTYRQGMPPKILFDTKDKIHGIYALAAKRGDDDKAIKDIIGRHPEKGMMVIADESTDMPTSLLKALPNLESGSIHFQVVAIGNSLSKFDLHGSLSTPKDGWKSINPMTMTQWETTQRNGLCLFFSCYESPAIHEQDPVKRALLSRFYITKEQIDAKEKLYGKNSDSFWRFVLGFWRDDGTDDVVLSRIFLDEFNVRRATEWSGMHNLTVVAGLDPAFSTGGDQCVLRLGILGQDVNGRILLDFRKEELLFKIQIMANARDENNRPKSAELQIADKVIAIMTQYNCNLANMAVDASGQGRAIAEVIRLRANVLDQPIKIYSTRVGNIAQKSFDVTVKTSLELWTDIRDFIQTDQLRGLDNTTIDQLTSRLIKVAKEGGRRVLENKADYKSRMGSISPALAHSPDEADSMALCLQAAKIKFGFTPGQKREVSENQSFELQKWHQQIINDKIEAETTVHQGVGAASFSSDVNSLTPIYSWQLHEKI